MPRKKAETTAHAAEKKETVTITAEISKTLYEQILASVKMWGLDSVDEWLLEAIMDKV